MAMLLFEKRGAGRGLENPTDHSAKGKKQKEPGTTGRFSVQTRPGAGGRPHTQKSPRRNRGRILIRAEAPAALAVQALAHDGRCASLDLVRRRLAAAQPPLGR